MEFNREGRNGEDEVCIEIREERAEMKRESMDKGKKVGAMSIYLGRRVGLNIRQIFRDRELFSRIYIYSGLRRHCYVCPKCTEICKGDKILRKE